MEKKKLKLSISGSSKKTFSSIEQAKSKSKNTVVIERETLSFLEKLNFRDKPINKSNKNTSLKPNNFIQTIGLPSSDFEKEN